MFNRYWREYPWFLQVILFGLMVFTFGSFIVVVCSFIVPAVSGYNVSQVASVDSKSSQALINISIWVQFAVSAAVFMLPPLVFANQAHPFVTRYLNLKKPGKQVHWLLVIIMWVGALPLFLELGALMHLVDLGKGANEMHSKNEELMKAYLKMDNIGDFLKALLIMAIAPAIGEELFFRGILLRFFYQRKHRIVFAIMLSSLFFSLAHGSPYNYIPIFLAGALLCITYYLTGSLLAGMLAHCLYNGSQIALEYIAGKDSSLNAAVQANQHLPLPIITAGLTLFAGGFYLLWKNRTPLPYNWADDFTPQELEERAKDPTTL